MVHPLTSYNLDAVITVDEALRLAENNLNELIQMASAPISGAEAAKTMTDNVRFVKQFYERAELLLMKEPV